MLLNSKKYKKIIRQSLLHYFQLYATVRQVQMHACECHCYSEEIQRNASKNVSIAATATFDNIS